MGTLSQSTVHSLCYSAVLFDKCSIKGRANTSTSLHEDLVLQNTMHQEKMQTGEGFTSSEGKLRIPGHCIALIQDDELELIAATGQHTLASACASGTQVDVCVGVKSTPEVHE